MTAVLARWNSLPPEEAAREILACCGSETWAASMASKRPIRDEHSLIETSDEVWRGLGEPDWLEAFRSHPRIEIRMPKRLSRRNHRLGPNKNNGRLHRPMKP